MKYVAIVLFFLHFFTGILTIPQDIVLTKYDFKSIHIDLWLAVFVLLVGIEKLIKKAKKNEGLSGGEA